MSIKIDWAVLTKTHSQIVANGKLKEDSDIIFTIVLKDKRIKKPVIKFKEFLNFIWSIAANPNYDIITLVAQDSSGQILYRHKQLNSSNEKIPLGSDSDVLANWSTLSNDEKSMYIKITVSQINAYEK